MPLAVALANLVASLAPIVAKLFVGGISEDEARKQSDAALAKFAADIRASRDADAERDKATDAALDAIDAAKPAPVMSTVRRVPRFDDSDGGE